MACTTNCKLTVIEAKAGLEMVKGYIVKQEESMKEYVEKMARAMKKGNLSDVKHCNNMITRSFASIAEYKVLVLDAEFRLKTAEMDANGFGDLVSFLYVLLEDDMKWWAKLVEKRKEDPKKFKENNTKAALVFASMNEEDAIDAFRRDLITRFNKLVHQVTEKVGEVTSFKLDRNEKDSFDGVVIGEKGHATIQTIMAEGPIQRFHYRTLIK